MRKFKEIISVALIFVFLFAISGFSPTAVSDNSEVYIGGQAFGVRFYANGAMIIKLESYYDGEKYVCPAKDGGLKVNDIIKKINNIEISTNEELKSEIEKSNGNEISVEIERNGKVENKTVLPIKNTVGVYLLGAWVRDSCAGIGTMTYYDDNNNYFAALGHGICDCDTSALLPLKSGETVQAEISGIEKSVCGKAGSYSGYFTDTKLGSLSVNSPLGIFGDITDESYKNNKKYPIAKSVEVKTGKATMVTTVNGAVSEEYAVEIKRICNHGKASNENFVIKITDSRLLSNCGGIVQGMSGSPIVQNGKIVGAVTHVFLNNPKEGYGVFAQYMAEYYNNQH